MVEKFNTYITPFKLERRVHVYLPKGYYESNERYPVIYMFDGHNLFFNQDATYGKSWGLQEFMDDYKTKMIIIGVECNHVGNERLYEYLPYNVGPKYFLNTYMEGRGKTYMDWLTGEFKEAMDKKYRTLSDRSHTMIAGSSMGGLMSLYSIVKYNHMFKYAACLSSSIMLCMDDLIRDIRQTELNPDTKIYMDFGGEEWKTKIALKMHKEIEDELLKKNVSFKFYFEEKAEHCERDWEKRIPIYMKYLFEE